MRILGIDPGTRVVGFGLLECSKPGSFSARDYRIVDAGVLKTDQKVSQAQRLGAIHEAMYQLVFQWKPTLSVIEGAFFGCNPRSALVLGQARGALIAALSRCKVPVQEIAPTKVKVLITGHGHSSKEQVSSAMQRLLSFDQGSMPLDVSDALAIALSYCLGGGHKENRVSATAEGVEPRPVS